MDAIRNRLGVGRGVGKAKRELTAEEKIYSAGQYTMMWRRFRKHRLGLLGAAVTAAMYLMAIFSQFLAVYPTTLRSEYIFMQPTPVHFIDSQGTFHLRPFVYGITSDIDLSQFKRAYSEDTSKMFPIYFLVQAEPYKLFGLIPTDIHLFGVDVAAGGAVYLCGTDSLGRDLFSRLMYASAISLSVGFLSVIIGFVQGTVIGGYSGYKGGMTDLVIQRISEFIGGIPTIPIWMALSVAIPRDWSDVQVYFAITMVLALTTGWGGSRTVRSKLLQTREEDFVMAAQIAGASDARIIGRHLLPQFMSYLIVTLTLSIPGVVMGETGLSFLGLGLRPPTVSWGVLLQDGQNIRTLVDNPWMMWPVVFVVTAVVAFNFMGDGLRDAADPYGSRG